MHTKEQTIIIAPGVYPAYMIDGLHWVMIDRPVAAQATAVDALGLTYYQVWVAGKGLIRLHPERCTLVASPLLN